jgi:CRISPR-associated protein Cas1
MGTLYIDRKELHIRLDGQALAFYRDGEREGLGVRLILPIKLHVK